MLNRKNVEDAMKRGLKVFGVLSVAVVLTVVFAASSYAQYACGKMEPALVNATSVQLKNVSGKTCGTSLLNNQTRLYQLDSSKSDPLLAILLTALSLNKTVWVYAGSDNGDGSDIVSIVAVAK